MGLSRAAAKAAGAAFERLMADYFKKWISKFIDRQPKTGAKDKGDLSNVYVHDEHLVACEVKRTARLDLAGWAAEAEQERINLGAIAGIIIHKRHGKGKPGDQWVTMTARDFAAIVTGRRPD